MFWSISPVHFITFSLSHVFRFLHHWRCYQSGRSVLSQRLSQLQSNLQCIAKLVHKQGKCKETHICLQAKIIFRPWQCPLLLTIKNISQQNKAGEPRKKLGGFPGCALQTYHPERRGHAAWPLQGSACTVCPQPSLHLKIHTADTFFPWSNTIHTRVLVRI